MFKFCLQEIFSGLRPGQDKRWYDAGANPGPTTDIVADMKKYEMVIVSLYEEDAESL